MGFLISFRSTRMLLQREDFPAALAALRAHLEDCPDDADPAGGPEGGDLLAVLDAIGWAVTLNQHGDVTGLRYRGDKPPYDCTEDWPYYILAALAPHLCFGEFRRWSEPDTEEWLLVTGRRDPVSITTRALPSRRIVERRSPLDDRVLRPMIAAADLPRAHEAVRRYAHRNRGRPGAEFLAGVLAGADLREALAAAGLGIELTEAGAVGGFRLVGGELAGAEELVWGVFAALEGIVTGQGGLSFGLAGEPRQRIEYAYRWTRNSHEWGLPIRSVRDRP